MGDDLSMTLKKNVLIGYAFAAWATGFKSTDKDKIGECLDIRECDLDFVCNKLKELEEDDIEDSDGLPTL